MKKANTSTQRHLTSIVIYTWRLGGVHKEFFYTLKGNKLLLSIPNYFMDKT